MAFFKLKMGQGAAGRKAGEENRKAVYKYFVETNPEGGIKDCSKALGLHPQTVRKHYRALAKQEAAKDGEPVTVQSFQMAQPAQPAQPATRLPAASAKPFDTKKENLTPEEIKNIDWNQEYVKERFGRLRVLDFDRAKITAMEEMRDMGASLEDAVDFAYGSLKD